MRIDWLIINLNELVKWSGIFLAVLVVTWHIIHYVLLTIKEKEIFKVKEKIDELDCPAGLCLSDFFLDKFRQREEKRLRNRLEKLMMERQFMLDKLPLLGFLKK